MSLIIYKTSAITLEQKSEVKSALKQLTDSNKLKGSQFVAIVDENGLAIVDESVNSSAASNMLTSAIDNEKETLLVYDVKNGSQADCNTPRKLDRALG